MSRRRGRPFVPRDRAAAWAGVTNGAIGTGGHQLAPFLRPIPPYQLTSAGSGRGPGGRRHSDTSTTPGSTSSRPRKASAVNSLAPRAVRLGVGPGRGHGDRDRARLARRPDPGGSGAARGMTGARLDRMPVAIELATARADALLLDRIDDRFALLAEGDRLAQDRLAQGLAALAGRLGAMELRARAAGPWAAGSGAWVSPSGGCSVGCRRSGQVRTAAVCGQKVIW